MLLFRNLNAVRFVLAASIVTCTLATIRNVEASTNAKKPLRFLVVAPGKTGDSHCLQPTDPCLIPTAGKAVTITDYTATEVTGRPEAISLTFQGKQGNELTHLMNGHVGERIAIVLDGKVIFAPVVKTAMTEGHKLEISASPAEDIAGVKASLGVSKQ
jgi:preprotein translocase subunit SecD